MIIYHIKDLMLKKSAKMKIKITYADIVNSTGISRITLSKMASKNNHNACAKIVEKLCCYFECTPNDLMSIIPDEQ